MTDTMDEKIDPAELMRQYRADRGDIFAEVDLMAREIPHTVHLLHRSAGYLLVNKNQSTPDQLLSVQMRELIATAHLSAKGAERFAPNHVRRLYRLGVTNRLILEAAEGVAPILGHSAILHAAKAIVDANDPAYPVGELPPGGEPKEIVPFPELQLGRERKQPIVERLLDTAEWRTASSIDLEFATRSAAFVDHCLGLGRNDSMLLGPGIRAMLAATGACVRGRVDSAAGLIGRAYAYGLDRRRIFEAICVTMNMTGAETVKIGVAALEKADLPHT
jgi:alkylhydroperoxidase/carboxymuconolactone decarboxylase family protein YurZ